MPDISAVEDALADAIAAALTIDGTGTSAATGHPVRVTRDWPNDAELAADLAAGVSTYTVAALPGMSRETTRYPTAWQTIAAPPPTVTLAVAGNTVTVTAPAGPLAPQLVGVRVAGVPSAYAVQPTDTAATIAAALAAASPGATAAGPVVTYPTGDLLARVVGFASQIREIRREVAIFRMCGWFPDSASRDAACTAIDLALAAVAFLSFPDGSCGRLRYQGSYSSDSDTKSGLWRRDLRWSVEYPTVQSQSVPTVLWGILFDPDTGTQTVS